ncbi:MAG: hypothetical protein ACM3QV_00145 [Caulobacteraceae bacterium]
MHNRVKSVKYVTGLIMASYMAALALSFLLQTTVPTVYASSGTISFESPDIIMAGGGPCSINITRTGSADELLEAHVMVTDNLKGKDYRIVWPIPAQPQVIRFEKGETLKTVTIEVPDSVSGHDQTRFIRLSMDIICGSEVDGPYMTTTVYVKYPGELTSTPAPVPDVTADATPHYTTVTPVATDLISSTALYAEGHGPSIMVTMILTGLAALVVALVIAGYLIIRWGR